MVGIGYMNRQSQISILNQAEKMLCELDNLKKQKWNITSGIRRKNSEIERARKTNKIILLLIGPALGAGICLSAIFLLAIVIPDNEGNNTTFSVPLLIIAVFICALAFALVAIAIKLLKKRISIKQKELALEISAVHPEVVRADNAVKVKADDIARYYNNYQIPRELIYKGDLIYVRNYLSRFPEKSLGDAFESLELTRERERNAERHREMTRLAQEQIAAIKANTKATQEGFDSVNQTINNAALGIRITMADYLR